MVTQPVFSPRSVQALLFDLDGTVADTDPVHQRAWLEVLASHGVQGDSEFYRTRIAGRRNAEIVASVLPWLSADAAVQLAEHKEALFRERAAQGLSALRGLHELLAAAQQRGWATALVTNAPRANVQHVLSALGLQFPLLVLAEDLAHGKPHPQPYLSALSQLRVGPEQAVAFEDSPSGVRSAVAAGIATVGLLTGHSPEALLDAGAQLCVDDFAAPALLSALDVP